MERLQELPLRIDVLTSRIDTLEAQFVRFGQEVRREFSAIHLAIASVRQEARELNDETRREMRQLNDETRQEMQRLNDETRQEMQRLNDETCQEMQRLNDETRTHMRVLHEEVLSRIAAMGEARNGRTSPSRHPTRTSRRRRRKKA